MGATTREKERGGSETDRERHRPERDRQSLSKSSCSFRKEKAHTYFKDIMFLSFNNLHNIYCNAD